ncbi:hypothetical protein CU097_013427 [Rhizopus azygosporus]|uniref:Uncharacterized protein n=1 Tax=Rhizopus azygosporus TaxID=86630 RepID=A0A367JXK8_RHIAZ|nr:hypothetical protein CU097_013427 [Rhizopus azygosporus]
MSDTTVPIFHTTNTITDTIGTTDAAAVHYQEFVFAATETMTDDVENTSPLKPWMFQGMNVAELFIKFQQAVIKKTTNQLFFIESSVHELLSLSNILFLCTSQHSPLCMDMFSEDILVELNKEMLVECMDFKQDMCDDACMKLTRFMNNMDSKSQSKDDVEIDLLVLGRSLSPLQGSLLRGITAAQQSLYQQDYNEKDNRTVKDDIIPVAMPDPFELHKPDSTEKFITYLPHSGFHNQRISLENAFLLASYLNRTLLLPPVYLASPAFPWLRFDKMYERILLQTKNGIEYCGQLREGEPLPPECLNYSHWTSVPWTFFYDFEGISKKIRVIFRNDMSLEWIRDELSSDIYFIKDNSPFDYRIYDLPESQTPLQRFVHRLELDALEAIKAKVIHFGSLFGSYRVLAQSEEHKDLLTWVRRNMVFQNPVLLQTASRIINQLGGVKQFVGIHFRVGDGLFKVRASIHVDDIYHQLVNEYTDLTVDEVAQYDTRHDDDRKEDTNYEVKQLRDTPVLEAAQQPIQVTHPPDTILQARLGTSTKHHLKCQSSDGRNNQFAKTTIYIATDCPNPREHPLLQKIFKTFPCVFVLSDFKSDLKELAKIKVAEDNVHLESYLIPMIDAIIAAQGFDFYGTNSSTFSTYIERQLHPMYTNEPIKLFDAPSL